jgi:hypothetical protein
MTGGLFGRCRESSLMDAYLLAAGYRLIYALLAVA